MMTDTTSHGGTGPSHRGVEIGVAVAMIAFGAVVIVGSLQVGIGWGPEGPKSGFFPFYLGVTIILASVLNLVAAATESSQKVFADWSQLVSVVSVVIPTTIYVFGPMDRHLPRVADPDRRLHEVARPLQHRDVRRGRGQCDRR